MTRLTDQERIWRSVPESDVVAAVLDRMNRERAYAWRNNTGSMAGEHKGKRWFVRFSEPGAPDIIAILPGNLVLFIECKTETGKQSEAQIAWQQAVEERDGVYLVCRPSSWQEVIDAAIGALAAPGGREANG